MYNRYTVGDLAKPIPKLYHVLCSSRRRRRTHEFVEISSVGVFQNDIVGVVVNKASVVGDNEGRGFAVETDIYECIVLGFVLLFGIWAAVRLKNESISQVQRALLFKVN